MRNASQLTQKTAASITFYLAFCMCVYGLFGFSFYKMLQPRQIANIGLAAYKPPLAAVLGYDPTERFAYIGRVLIEDASDGTFIETTVASSETNRLMATTEAGHN